MAILYTDLALVQSQGNNIPGEVGEQLLTPSTPPYQNLAVAEGPPEIIATYVLTGAEAANDVIRIAIAQPGWIVSPKGSVCSGVVAPATTLTCAVGDTDLGVVTDLPVVNPQAIVSQPTGYQAPTWVSATSYVPGNVVLDATSTPANRAYTCISATSATTAPHSAATTVWMPNSQRYSASIDISGASSNVAFAGGTQLYGGPASRLPNSVIPGTAQTGYSATAILCQPYVIQNDAWITALLLTVGTPVANTTLTFRIGVFAPN